MSKPGYLSVLLLVSACMVLHSLESIDNLSSLFEAVKNNNVSLKSSLWEKEKIENNMPSILTWDESSLSFSQSYNESLTDELNSSGRLEVSVIDAAYLYGETDFEGSGEAGINLSPLWHSDERALSKLELETAESTVESTLKTVAYSASEAYLNWSLALMTWENNNRNVSLYKEIYEDEKVKYDLGESTLDDVSEALINWSESRSELSQSLETLKSKNQSLYEITGLDASLYSFKTPESEHIESEIEKLESILKGSTTDINNLDSIRKQLIDTRSLNAELDNIRVFDPQMNLDASVNWDNEDSWLSASATVSFALDDYNRKEKMELSKDIDLAGLTLNQLIQSEELKLNQYKDAVETSLLDYELALLELEQSDLLVEEARFLLGTGDYSEMELEEILIENRNSRIKVFETLIQKYLALSILQYYI